MTATKTTPAPLFKPWDEVRTQDLRYARIVEILPGHRRVIEYLDGTRERVTLPVAQLAMVREAAPRPWRHHSPQELRSSGAMRPLKERAE